MTHTGTKFGILTWVTALNLQNIREKYIIPEKFEKIWQISGTNLLVSESDCDVLYI